MSKSIAATDGAGCAATDVAVVVTPSATLLLLAHSDSSCLLRHSLLKPFDLLLPVLCCLSLPPHSSHDYSQRSAEIFVSTRPGLLGTYAWLLRSSPCQRPITCHRYLKHNCHARVQRKPTRYATDPPYPKVYKAFIQHVRNIKIDRTTSKLSEHMASYIQELIKEKCIVQQQLPKNTYTRKSQTTTHKW